MSTFVLNKSSEIVAECFSAHYTNIFLIYLYDEARKYVEKEANVPSLTEGYKTAIAVYNNAMSRPDFVKETLHGIYNQFLKIDKTMRIRECTTKILSGFYPDDGYKGIIKQEKYIELAISKIIYDVTKQIIYTIPVNHAKSIIDHNEDPKTQNAMQDDFTQIILELMERNHIEYLSKKKASYHHPATDHVLFEKTKGELTKLSSEKSELEAKHAALAKQLSDLSQMNNNLREKVGNQQSRIRELENQVQSLTNTLQEQKMQNVQAQMQNAQTQMQNSPAHVNSAHSSLIQTGPIAPQYTAQRAPIKDQRNYNILSDSDDEDIVVEKKPPAVQKQRSHIIDDDEEISLDMFK